MTLWAQGLVDDSADIAVIIAAIPLLKLWWRLEGAGPGERKALAWVLAACVRLLHRTGRRDAGSPTARLRHVSAAVSTHRLRGRSGRLAPGLSTYAGSSPLSRPTPSPLSRSSPSSSSLITLRSLGAQAAAGPVAGVVAFACALPSTPRSNCDSLPTMLLGHPP